MTFWIIVIGLAVLVALMLGLALLRPRPGGEPASAYDLRVYRDQLKEVERDLGRGVIGAADAERIRAEISRRILAADAQLQRESEGRGQPRRTSVAAAATLAAIVIAGSMWLYQRAGAPGYGDLALRDRVEMAATARAERPGQAEAEASLTERPPQPALSPDYVALIEQLRATVAGRPDDLQGHLLLARHEAASGNFQAAYAAQERVIALKGGAVEAQDYANYADMLVLAAGGYVSPEAEAALATALELDRRNGAARYYWGLMMGQTGRPDVAFRIWVELLQEGPDSAGWIEPIRLQIEDMAMRAGQANFVLPPPANLPGPTAEDIAAAEEMSAEDRNAMIRGMVEGLSDRLATEGGPPEDWARLIGALGVLGEEAQAIAIYNNALEVFAANDAAIDIIRAGARQAGLIP